MVSCCSVWCVEMRFDVPAVFESEEPDWLKASRADGKKGLVPANYVELLS